MYNKNKYASNENGKRIQCKWPKPFSWDSVLSLCKVINTQDYQLVKVVDKKYMRPSVIIARTITLWGEMNSAVSAIKSGFLMSIGSTLNYGIFDY